MNEVETMENVCSGEMQNSELFNRSTSAEEEVTPDNGVEYAIRKITPREAWRLMDFKDEDYDKASAVVSPTRLYAAAGNSIVVACLSAIFSQLNVCGCKPWNDRTDDEKYELLNKYALGKGRDGEDE